MMNKLMIVFMVSLYILPSAFAEEYKISKGDVLNIEIWDEKDLSGDFRVDSQGYLAMNWLDPIKAEGLTISNLKDEILKILSKKYVKKPRLTKLMIKEAASGTNNITVVGAVKEQGVFKFKESYTAMQAIVDAGGFTKYASKNKTMLIRGKGKKQKRFTLKMKEVMDKGNKKEDMVLEPGDVIIAKEGFL